MCFRGEHMVIRIVGNDEAMFDRNSHFAKSVYIMSLMLRRNRSVPLVSENNNLIIMCVCKAWLVTTKQQL